MRCYICQRLKSADQFHKDRTRPSGYSNRCIICDAIRINLMRNVTRKKIQKTKQEEEMDKNAHIHNNENWADIKGYEVLYQISDQGYLRSIKNGLLILLKPRLDCNGYYRYNLSKNNRKSTRVIHRLVLLAFKGPCPKKYQAAHLDGNPKNNRIKNLIWATVKENNSHKIAHKTQQHGSQMWNSKLTEVDIIEIRKLKKQGMTQKNIAVIYNVAGSTIDSVITKKTWKHV